MLDIWNSVNNRELAVLTWLAMGLGAIAFVPSLRSALAGVARAFAQPMILAALGAASLYIGLWVWLMAEIDLWTIANLKSTIVWAISFAFVTMFNINRVIEDKDFFGTALRQTVGVTAVLTFVMQLFDFGYLVELLIFPMLFCVQAMHIVSQGNPDFRSVEKLLDWLLALVGLSYLIYCILRLADDPGKVMTITNVREFLIPIVLSGLFLGFIYFFGLYVGYASSFASLAVAIPDANLRRYAKRAAIRQFGGNLDFLRRWKREIHIERPSDRAAIDAIFERMGQSRTREKNPPAVPTKDGWAPSLATRFLDDHGLGTRDYHRSFENEWFASSSLVEIDAPGLFKNNLGYYIDGNELAATALKLKLNVNDPANAKPAEEKFRAVGNSLIAAALGNDTAEGVQVELWASHTWSRQLPHGHIALEKDEWQGGVQGGYSLMLTLSRGTGVSV